MSGDPESCSSELAVGVGSVVFVNVVFVSVALRVTDDECVDVLLWCDVVEFVELLVSVALALDVVPLLDVALLDVAFC